MRENRERGKITLKILEILGHTSLVTVDLLDILFSGAHRATGKQSFETLKRMSERHEALEKIITDQKERHRLYNLLSKLQREGLISKEKDEIKKSKWFITSLGIKKKLSLKEKSKIRGIISDIPNHYLTKPSKRFLIIIFDIPEKYRKKRAWLRSILKNAQYKKLQQSVWLGKRILPKDFFNDLKKLDLLENVKIFSIAKSGSIFE